MPSSARTAREQLAALAAFDDAPAVGAVGLEVGHVAPGSAFRQIRPEAAATQREHDLRPLRPPLAEHPVQLRRNRRRGPELCRPGQRIESSRCKIEREREWPCTGARVRENRRAGALATLNQQTRNEPGHRSIVADEHPIPATDQGEPKPPPHAPTLLVHHRLKPSHAIEDRLRQHRIVPVGEEHSPTGEIGGGRPQPPRCSCRLGHLRIRFVVHGVGEGIDVVGARPGRIRAQARPGEAERIEDPPLQDVGVRLPRDAHHDLAEQGEDEVRVVPQLAGPKHELGILEAGDQLLAGRRLHRLPDLTGRLALDAGEVAERHPHRRPDRRLRQVRAQRRLEVDAPCLDELHDQDGGEGLRDRADAVDVVARRCACGGDVGDAEHALPDHLTVAEDARRDRGHPLLGLRGGEEPVELGCERLRRGHEQPPARRAPARGPGRCRRRRDRGA